MKIAHLALCLSVFAAIADDSAFAQDLLPEPVLTSELTTFTDWCEARDQINSSALYTVEQLLIVAETRDCDRADERLSAMTVLPLGGTGVTSLEPLTTLPHFEEIFLWGNGISDITPLAVMENLTRTNLAGNYIVDLSPLTGLEQLTWLELSSNLIYDVSALAELDNLQDLYLAANAIADPSPLATLDSLSYLVVAWNEVADLNSLAAAPQLSKIDARFNNIVNIESLENFTMLDRIYLRGNPLSAPVCPLQPTEICQFTDAEFEDSPTIELAE